jgi:tetratricopeptide (TPR) repeat protein
VVTAIFNRKDSNTTPLQKCMEQLAEYQEAEANLLVEIATLYYENDDTEEAVRFLDKAVNIYGELGYSEQEASILELIGDVYVGIDNNNNALDYYRQSYKLYSSTDVISKDEVLEKINKLDDTDQKRDISGVENKISTEELEEVKSVSHESNSIDYVEIGKRLDDVLMLLDEYSVYEAYKNYKNPLSHIQEAYEMSSSIGDEKGEAALLLIMGNIQLKEKRSKNALDSSTEALHRFRKIADQKGEAISMLLIGTLYYILGDNDEGYAYLSQSIDILKDIGELKTEKVAKDLLNSLYG